MEEIWENIEGFEGIYQVSNLGKVKSLKFGKEKYLSITKSSIGYLNTKLQLNKKNKSFLVHRLVAETFIKNEFNKPCVNHINGIKTDNRIENLEWCTHKENTEHSLKNDLIKTGCNRKQSKLSLKDKEYIRKNYKEKDKKNGGYKLAEMFGVSRNCISNVVKNKTYRIY